MGIFSIINTNIMGIRSIKELIAKIKVNAGDGRKQRMGRIQTLQDLLWNAGFLSCAAYSKLFWDLGAIK